MISAMLHLPARGESRSNLGAPTARRWQLAEMVRLCVVGEKAAEEATEGGCAWKGGRGVGR